MSMKVTKEQFIGVSYNELLAENAKLRELVETMHMRMVNSWREHRPIECDMLVDTINRMRELGIEVPE